MKWLMKPFNNDTLLLKGVFGTGGKKYCLYELNLRSQWTQNLFWPQKGEMSGAQFFNLHRA